MAGQEQHFLLVFEQFELKPWLDKARKANTILLERYGYKKCIPHIDLFEMCLCDHYLTIDDFGRLSRKYLTRTTEAKW